MSTNTTVTSSGATWFIAGLLIAGMAIVGFVYFGGDLPAQDKPDIRIEVPGAVIEGEAK